MTAQELRDKFQKDIEALQEACPHVNTSWAEQMWAPGHMTGNQVQYCIVCEKVLDTKASTWKLAQYGVNGNGDVIEVENGNGTE